MIYCDKIGHLISSTSFDELHEFASKIGLRREWFQEKDVWSHYDLTSPRMIQKAISAGAKLVSPKVLVLIIHGFTEEEAILKIKRVG